MNTEDDFISKLMDETYQKVEHPENELSNQNVKSLADYFSKREEILGSERACFKEFKSFYRLEVDGQSLDIPKNLGWVNEDQKNGHRLYRVTDNVLVGVLSQLRGETVEYIEVTSDGLADFLSDPPHENPKIPKVA